MANPTDLAQLEKDFFSGRNPLAYIPLCNGLRKQKNFARALEICQRGLSGDPNSIAGRTLLARLLSDLGHYEEALKEIAKAEATAPEANGLMTEKVRCLIKLRRMEEAARPLELLTTRNPMDPQVQLLNNQFRQMKATVASSSTQYGQSGVHARFIRMTNQQMLDIVLKEMKGHCNILSCAVIPTGAGEPALHGDPRTAESAYAFWKDAAVSCQELDCGDVRMGLMETEAMQLIVLVRKSTIMALCIQPTANFGKVYYRFQMVAGQLVPETLKQNTEA